MDRMNRKDGAGNAIPQGIPPPFPIAHLAHHHPLLLLLLLLLPEGPVAEKGKMIGQSALNLHKWARGCLTMALIAVIISFSLVTNRHAGSLVGNVGESTLHTHTHTHTHTHAQLIE